ncbi:ASCH domain-containing protein [Corynebacterium hindlerae]|uniref:ASCH domain-containing protein n=1 Tax=Corynebacterium hindlerae TaxID=699041 RepID=UPI001AD61E8C|nr:ASCH domain-containing protein [Corynebacterium hindlerae]QTH58552.1 ASCH domain-containing protein [Corynebacterium hindlerae]
MISPEERNLIRVVRSHAEQTSNGDATTVAAGLLTASGQIILGVNVYHFLGGPCAEVSALSKHAEIAADDPVTTVVAVYGPAGDVISPCGKCRQILFDLDPNIKAIVRTPNGFVSFAIRELLPHPYDWRAAENPQCLYMWEGYEGMIRSGVKQQTIRVDDPFVPGPATIVFEKSDGSVVELAATVSSSRTILRHELTNEIARADGFMNLKELNAALDIHYPELEENSEVDVVSFELAPMR